MAALREWMEKVIKMILINVNNMLFLNLYPISPL